MLKFNYLQKQIKKTNISESHNPLYYKCILNFNVENISYYCFLSMNSSIKQQPSGGFSNVSIFFFSFFLTICIKHLGFFSPSVILQYAKFSAQVFCLLGLYLILVHFKCLFQFKC